MVCRSYQRGFTLIELVIVIVVVSIIAVVAAPLLQTAVESTEHHYDQSTIVNEGRVAMTRLARDLRNVRSVETGFSPALQSLSFTDVSGHSIQYAVSGSNLLRNSRVLLSHLAAFQFQYFDADGQTTSVSANVRYIRIVYTLSEGAMSESFNQLVFLRNAVVS